MTDSAKWEEVSDHVGDFGREDTTRLKVLGGWLYRVREWQELHNEAGDVVGETVTGVALTFVPDERDGFQP